MFFSGELLALPSCSPLPSGKLDRYIHIHRAKRKRVSYIIYTLEMCAGAGVIDAFIHKCMKPTASTTLKARYSLRLLRAREQQNFAAAAFHRILRQLRRSPALHQCYTLAQRKSGYRRGHRSLSSSAALRCSRERERERGANCLELFAENLYLLASRMAFCYTFSSAGLNCDRFLNREISGHREKERRSMKRDINFIFHNRQVEQSRFQSACARTRNK